MHRQQSFLAPAIAMVALVLAIGAQALAGAADPGVVVPSLAEPAIAVADGAGLGP